MDEKKKELIANLESARNLFNNTTDELLIDKAILRMTFADRLLVKYEEFQKAEREYNNLIGRLG